MKRKLKCYVNVERAKTRMTQVELAEKIGCTNQHLMMIETERANPSLVLALKISEYFGKSVHELFKLNED